MPLDAAIGRVCCRSVQELRRKKIVIRYHRGLYYIRADYNNLEILGQKWRALTNYLALTGIRLCHIWHHFYFEHRDWLITFPIFVLSQCLIARNVRELFSFNRGVSHLNEICRIDDVSRGSLSCYEILTNN